MLEITDMNVPPPTCKIYKCDSLCTELPNHYVDLVFGSPPYENARSYDGLSLYSQDRWVTWATQRYLESLRVCRGLVAWVVNGRTRSYEWSGTPFKLWTQLQLYASPERGVYLRKPLIFHRVGIPGSGGPDWLRDDYEFIICASSHPGRLPWSDNTARGNPPKYDPGGPPTHRTQSDERVKDADYKPPKHANPGNVLSYPVGCGKMGHKLAHENEAPFPEKLADFMIASFCPPGGTVLDPFGGSGTTAAAALKLGRNAISIDIRQSQCDLTRKRLLDEGLIDV